MNKHTGVKELDNRAEVMVEESSARFGKKQVYFFLPPWTDYLGSLLDMEHMSADL